MHLETALARCPDADQSVRAQLLAAWAIENVREPRMRGEVLAASQQSLALAEQSGDDHCIPAVLTQRYATMHALFEDPAECVRINRRLLTWASRSGSARMRLSAALGLAQSSMRFGEFAIADRYMSEAARLSASLDDPARLWLVQGWQAMRTLVLGKTALAEQLTLGLLQPRSQDGSGGCVHRSSRGSCSHCEWCRDASLRLLTRCVSRLRRSPTAFHRGACRSGSDIRQNRAPRGGRVHSR